MSNINLVAGVWTEIAGVDAGTGNAANNTSYPMEIEPSAAAPADSDNGAQIPSLGSANFNAAGGNKIWLRSGRGGWASVTID